MQSDTDGKNIKPFFDEVYRENDDYIDPNVCNCLPITKIENTFSVDHSEDERAPQLYLIDSSTGELIISDHVGCRCRKIPTATCNGVQNVRADSQSLYCSSNITLLHLSVENRVDGVPKHFFPINDFLIYGSHAQPYPPNECLSPKSDDEVKVKLLEKTDRSLHLQMPEFHLPEGCSNTSTATTEYIVYCEPVVEDDYRAVNETCITMTTFGKTLEVNGLQPYTKYVFWIGLANFYSEMKDSFKNEGGEVTLRTDVGGKLSVSVTALVV